MCFSGDEGHERYRKAKHLGHSLVNSCRVYLSKATVNVPAIVSAVSAGTDLLHDWGGVSRE